MAKVILESIEEYYHFYPQIAAVITAKAGDKANAMAAAWHSAISFKPPIYGVAIAPKRYTCQLVLEGGQFAVNFLPFEAAELIASVGGSSGSEVDKFHRFNIEVEPPLKIAAPILKDAYASYECRLIGHHLYGDHQWLVGEVVAIHMRGEAFTHQHILDLARVKPALYLGAEYYTTADSGMVCFLDRQVYGKR
ncbi:MAG TPA: flavin reductase family protein [Dehalococcoidia bacterium]|nr:flavin reductase family protein [Dehalococcoidia bacterium]